jgi:hypothetical protein
MLAPADDERGPRLTALQAALLARRDLVVTGLAWATGVIVAARRAGGAAGPRR